MNNLKPLKMLEIIEHLIFFISILFIRIFFIGSFFIRIFSIRITRRNFYIISNITWQVFSFNNIFLLFQKHLRIIIITCSINRIDQNYCSTNTLRIFFQYLVVMKFYADFFLVRFYFNF